MNATLSLARGRFYGRPLATSALGGVTVTDSWYEPRTCLPTHGHEHANLCLVLTGSFDDASGSTSRTCRSATLLYRPPGELHAQRFHADGARCVTIEPPLGWSGYLASRGDRSVDLQGLPATLALRLYCALRNTEGAGPSDGSDLGRRLLSATAVRVRLREQQLPPWFYQARALLLADPTRRLRVGRLAAFVGVHPVHLARTFRNAFGQRVTDFVLHLRIQAACHLLLIGERSVSRIAANLGFSDHSHLTRMFLRTMGQTPSAFRKRMAGLRPLPEP
jgi:AraC family transcriptional regulator